MTKIKHDNLLIKVGQASYTTPCGTYSIEYNNMMYLDDINWIAKRDGFIILYSETLQSIIELIVVESPIMKTRLYKILYGVED